MSGSAVETAEAAAVRAGDEAVFAELVERHRHELRVHCYRMLGSYDDAEDMVQETFLRAWRKRAGFEGRSSFRAWLYRIATNACIDDSRRPQRVLPHQLELASYPQEARPPRNDLPWLQPYPDRLLGDGRAVVQEQLPAGVARASGAYPAGAGRCQPAADAGRLR